MKIINDFPKFSSPEEAIQYQRFLSSEVILTKGPSPDKVKIVAGVDVSYERSLDTAFGVVVLIDANSLEVIEVSFAFEEKPFPYIPGLLAFREIPSLIKAFEKLKNTPDLILCDSQGIAHPRGLGLASHLGIILNIPTIGAAKKKLCGEYREPDNIKGAFSPLYCNGKTVGFAFRSRENTKPIFLSPGWGVDFYDVIYWAKKYSIKYRILYPIRLAHIESNRVRKQFLENE